VNQTMRRGDVFPSKKDQFYWPNHPFRNRNWSTSPRVTCSNFPKRSINEWGCYKFLVVNSTELRFVDKREENLTPWLARFHAGLCFLLPLFR